MILKEQSPAKLFQIRDMFYELLSNCIPANIIIERLTKELLKSLDDQLKYEVVYWAVLHIDGIYIYIYTTTLCLFLW